MKIDFSQKLTDLDGNDIPFRVGQGVGMREALELLASGVPSTQSEYSTWVLQTALGALAGQDATLGRVCIEALLAFVPGRQDAPAQEKVQRWQLARRIHDEEGPELTVEEVALIKKLVGELYAPLVVGQAWEMLER